MRAVSVLHQPRGGACSGCHSPPPWREASERSESALDYVRRQFRVEHPLINQAFQTDGLDLFVERYGDLINASREGQRAMKEIIGVYLKRIEWDAEGIFRSSCTLSLETRKRRRPRFRSPRRSHEPDNFLRPPGDRRHRHTRFIHLRAIQGRRFGRGSCAGLPSGDQCDRRSHPLRSRLTGPYSLSTGRLGVEPIRKELVNSGLVGRDSRRSFPPRRGRSCLAPECRRARLGCTHQGSEIEVSSIGDWRATGKQYEGVRANGRKSSWQPDR
jgi:hypothetical protein